LEDLNKKKEALRKKFEARASKIIKPKAARPQ
jgi:hypothetical protein